MIDIGNNLFGLLLAAVIAVMVVACRFADRKPTPPAAPTPATPNSDTERILAELQALRDHLADEAHRNGLHVPDAPATRE